MKRFAVQLNCQTMAVYKSLKPCLNLIQRKGWAMNKDNDIWVYDNEGNSYHPVTGETIDPDHDRSEETHKVTTRLVLSGYPQTKRLLFVGSLSQCEDYLNKTLEDVKKFLPENRIFFNSSKKYCRFYTEEAGECSNYFYLEPYEKNT